MTSNSDEAGGRERGAGVATLSRRRFVKSCLVVATSLFGAHLLSRWAPLADQSAVAASGSDATTVGGFDPTRHQWAFVADTNSCIGCGLCVEACKNENHVPLDPEFNRTWVERHTVTADGTVFIDSPQGGINGFPPESTAPGAAGQNVRTSFFMPRLCMQCENSPCVSICPVNATYKTADGVILIDEDRCIGCGYCVVACPYGARYIVPAGGATPTGTAGVADKCTWCYHRITVGKLPACVEVCPVGARIFGDLNDPSSRVSDVLKNERVQVLRPALGTKPRVYYLGLEAENG